MLEPQRTPTDDAHLVAAVAVRRDVQAVAALTGAVPPLHEAVFSARLALVALSGTLIGADPAHTYRRLLEVIVTVEHLAVNTRVAYPDLEIAA